MPRLKFKKRCALCKDKMATITSFNQFPVCDTCQMKRIKGDIKDPKYKFLNVKEKLYQESYFLRSIKDNFIRFGSLSEKQVSAFKKVVKEMKSGKKDERKEGMKEKKPPVKKESEEKVKKK